MWARIWICSGAFAVFSLLSNEHNFFGLRPTSMFLSWVYIKNANAQARKVPRVAVRRARSENRKSKCPLALDASNFKCDHWLVTTANARLKGKGLNFRWMFCMACDWCDLDASDTAPYLVFLIFMFYGINIDSCTVKYGVLTMFKECGVKRINFSADNVVRTYVPTL